MVPVAERHPALAAPLHGQLLAALLPRAQHAAPDAALPAPGSDEAEAFAKIGRAHV